MFIFATLFLHFKMKIRTQLKRNRYIIIGLMMVCILQAAFLLYLWSNKDDKTYEVNLVEIQTKKDSMDFLGLQQDLQKVDGSLKQVDAFLQQRGISTFPTQQISADSLTKRVFISHDARHYSQYLVDLQNKLQGIPLGMPSGGYITSNFGNRVNPIPVRRTAPAPTETNRPTAARAAAPVAQAASTASAAPPKRRVIDAKIVTEKDSAGNMIKKVIPIYADEPAPIAKAVPAPSSPSPTAAPASKTNSQPAPARVEINRPAAEPDQIQFHKGVDIGLPFGSNVYATAAGTVIFAGPKGGYGNAVIISHGNGLATLYGHLSQPLVRPNQKVKVGQVIAKSGNSGRSTGPHLHYEVHKNNTPVNPKLFINP